MKAYGSDRVRVADDGTVELSSRLPKPGWTATIPRTLTTSEHPGTAVLWDGESFEVIGVTPVTAGVRYTLAPWPEENTMRFTETYDSATEQARVTEHRDRERREKHRILANVLGIFTGHLPADVQQHLAHELGTNAPLLTIISAVPPVVLSGIILNRFVAARMAEAIPPPGWLLLIAAYMSLDSALRFKTAFLSRRPLGSVAGFLAYALYYAIHPKRSALLPPVENDLGPHYGTTEVPPDIAIQDSIHMWGPILTLLSREDQARLRQRYEYDYKRNARATAAVIACFGTLGIVTSIQTLLHDFRFSALTSLVVASTLTIEQFIRFSRFSWGPAPSMLRFAVRPLVKKLL